MIKSKLTEMAFSKNGLGSGMTAEDVAKKHEVPVESIEAQIEKGMKVELEHTSDLDEARDIALDHLVEFPDYYDRLEKMEKEAEKNLEEEFISFLKEEMSHNEKYLFSNLTESEILNEGKILNWVRWKLAKFSIRFISDKSLEYILEAYYSDKNGNPTEKSKMVSLMSRKEKINKLRDVAESLPKDIKDKVINSEPAKKLEKQALINAGFAAIAGVGAAVSANLSPQASELSSRLKSDVGADAKIITGNSDGSYFAGTDATIMADGSSIARPYQPSNSGTLTTTVSGDSITRELPGNVSRGSLKLELLGGNIVRAASGLLATLASILFGAIWGGIIIAGVNVSRGLNKTIQATTLRKDEIVKEILKNKELKEEAEELQEAMLLLTESEKQTKAEVEEIKDYLNGEDVKDIEENRFKRIWNSLEGNFRMSMRLFLKLLNPLNWPKAIFLNFYEILKDIANIGTRQKAQLKLEVQKFLNDIADGKFRGKKAKDMFAAYNKIREKHGYKEISFMESVRVDFNGVPNVDFDGNVIEEGLEIAELPVKGLMSDMPGPFIKKKAAKKLIKEEDTSPAGDQEFGVPELKKFPLFDEEHVRSAIKFFNLVDARYEERLAEEIIKRMKKYGISKDVVGEKNRLKNYI
jgi:hypothetical protein